MKKGWAWKYQGIWYALHISEKDHLVLHAGSKFWDIREAIHLSVVRANSHRIFKIETSSEAFKVQYRSPSDRLWNRIDVSYDGLDEEFDDFFVMVTRVWENPTLMQSLTNSWSGKPGSNCV